jgi:hypothetical protein
VAAVLDDALFGPDGTQPPTPPPALPDPLAGLVTGSQPLPAPPVPPLWIATATAAAPAAPTPRGRATRRATPPARSSAVVPAAYPNAAPISSGFTGSQPVRPTTAGYRPPAPVRSTATAYPTAQPVRGTGGSTTPTAPGGRTRRRAGLGFGGWLLLLVLFGSALFGVLRRVLEWLISTFH